MTVYWLMFAPLAILAMLERDAPQAGQRLVTLFGLVAIVILTVLIGGRYQVGGDWFNYLGQFDYLGRLDLEGLLLRRLDIGYGLLNGYAREMGWGVIGVNVVSAVFFSIGLVTFCQAQPRPRLAMLVAVPYLVIVVGMGYTRQSVAIGFAMLGLVFLSRRSNVGFVVAVLLASMFHKSAIVLLPVAVLSTTEKKVWTAVWVSVAFILGYLTILQDSVDRLVSTYVNAQIQSQGAMIRVMMNALPALVFLGLRRNFDMLATERRLWTWLSLVALGSVGVLAVSPSSTAVDRMALYLIPIQLFVLARLPEALQKLDYNRKPVILAVVAYSAAIQFVWLNFAAHSYAWVPYRFYFFEAR